MGRLFWKFFFAFWLALIGAGVVVGVVVWLHKNAEFERQAYVAEGGPPRFITRTAASVLRTAGVDSLRTILKQWHEPFPLYAVDSEGVDLLGRRIDADVLAAVRRRAAVGESQDGVELVDMGGGHEYLLFVPAPGVAGTSFERPLPGEGEGGRNGPPPPWLPLGIALLASIGFSALLAWYMAKPIRFLRLAFEKAADGDLGIRVQPLVGERRDEIADLGRDYDRMASRLQELIDAQRRLFHDVSHELRSPLARLHAVTGLLRQDSCNTRDAVERIELEVGRLDELVGQLLLLARLEAGVPDVASEDVDLQELLAGIVEDARFEAESRGCHVEFHTDGPLVLVGKTEMLGRAFENLIRNAIHYTVQGSTVLVELFQEAGTGRAILQVSDRGPGVEPDALDAIFEPFLRGKSGGGRRGYGLGLAIARRAVEAHGGHISAVNRKAGGLRLNVTLPLRPPAD